MPGHSFVAGGDDSTYGPRGTWCQHGEGSEAHWKRVAGHAREQAEAPQERADKGEVIIGRVRGVVKDLIDAGNTYWAREILTALEPGSVDDHD